MIIFTYSPFFKFNELPFWLRLPLEKLWLFINFGIGLRSRFNFPLIFVFSIRFNPVILFDRLTEFSTDFFVVTFDAFNLDVAFPFTISIQSKLIAIILQSLFTLFGFCAFVSLLSFHTVLLHLSLHREIQYYHYFITHYYYSNERINITLISFTFDCEISPEILSKKCMENCGNEMDKITGEFNRMKIDKQTM